MVQPPTPELFSLPDIEALKPLQGDIEIVPGFKGGAAAYIQANASGDEMDIRLQSPEAQGTRFLHYIGNTRCVNLARGLTRCHLFGPRLSIEHTPDPIMSNHSRDRRSTLQSAYVCKLSIKEDFADWYCEWQRVRDTTAKNVRVTFKGRASASDPSIIDEVRLQCQNNTGQKVVFPQEVLALERWLTGSEHLKEWPIKGPPNGLFLKGTDGAIEALKDIWMNMWNLREVLLACSPNLDAIGRSVQITPENMFTGRDCASIFPKV